ncbi:MAG: hypothetical protein ACI8YQ_003470 [Polaribacter sp.]|jgi:hypothetical protein
MLVVKDTVIKLNVLNTKGNKMNTNEFKSKAKIDRKRKEFISDYPYKKYMDFYIE